MNEQALRSIVRAAVARHLGAAEPVAGLGERGRDVARGDVREESVGVHQAGMRLPLLTSQTLYAGLVNVGDACVIEPAVPCDHCGYCKSHGY